MSYILDALKKSEREKTLGQVPTLESVVSDGAKKQRSGTPLWLSIVVFFVALLAMVGILKMAGLLNFSGSDNENTASVESGQSQELAEPVQVQEQEADAVAALPEIEPPAEIIEKSNQLDQAMGNNSQTQETQSNQVTEITESMRATLELPLPGEEPQPSANAKVDEQVEITDSMRATLENAPLPGETVQTTANSQPIAEAEFTESMQATMEQSPLPEELLTENEAIQADSQENSTKALEEKFAAQEAEEIAALEQQLAAQQQSNNTQQSQPDYEEVIHDGLRDISVNVVSYSSDARQRFVMLDLTIYKEGDQLANNAQVIEIIRTGAIVEYQNKRYLLKP